MVSKCANPACSTIFRYLHEGRLFHLAVEYGAPEELASYETPTLESFWLCTECSRKMTVIADPTGVLVVPLQQKSAPKKSKIGARPWGSP
jgi:hypothetical protein